MSDTDRDDLDDEFDEHDDDLNDDGDDDLDDEDDDLDDEEDDDLGPVDGGDDDDGDDEDDFGYEDEEEEDDDGPDPNRVPAPTATTVLEYLVKAVVDDADSVDIEIEEGRRGLSLRAHVAPDDMGRVIGKRGRIANAIRTVVRAAAVKDGTEVDVDFVD